MAHPHILILARCGTQRAGYCGILSAPPAYTLAALLFCTPPAAHFCNPDLFQSCTLSAARPHNPTGECFDTAPFGTFHSAPAGLCYKFVGASFGTPRAAQSCTTVSALSDTLGGVCRCKRFPAPMYTIGAAHFCTVLVAQRCTRRARVRTVDAVQYDTHPADCRDTPSWSPFCTGCCLMWRCWG